MTTTHADTGAVPRAEAWYLQTKERETLADLRRLAALAERANDHDYRLISSEMNRLEAYAIDLGQQRRRLERRGVRA